MKIEEILGLKLGKFSQRYRLVEMGDAIITYFCYALGLYLALLIVNQFFPLPFPLPSLFLLLCLAGTFLGLGIGLFRRASLFWIACQTDKKLNLEEKVSTAWEYAYKERRNPLVRLLLKDALRSLEEVKGGQVFPHHWPKRGKYLIYLSLAILLILGLNYLPPLKFGTGPFSPAQLRQEGKLVRDLGEELMKKARREGLRETSALAPQIKKLGERMYGSKLEESQIFNAYDYFEKEAALRGEKARQEFLKGLRDLIKKGKLDEILQSQLLEQMQAIERGEYQEMEHLLEKSGLQGEEEKLRDLQTLKRIEEELKRSSQRLRENYAQKKGQGQSTEESRGQREDWQEKMAQRRGYGPGEEEDSLFGDYSEDISSAPGSSPGEEGKQDSLLESEEEGALSKVESQLGSKGSFLMALIRAISAQKSPGEYPEGKEGAFLQYQKLMMNRLARERIPGIYREQVKEYFSSLEPE